MSGAMYRLSNNNVNALLLTFHELLSMISNKNIMCYLLGDYILNLINRSTHSITAEFFDTILVHAFSSNY